jgi:cytochrome bd-type quinol oxidase subunit 2
VSFLHRLFPAGHFVISLLFLLSAIALILIAGLQLWQGIQIFDESELQGRLNSVLESIAVLTVAVAALELGQTILEEEVQRAAQMSAPTRVRRFLSRFMVVLVVALSIETVVLTFRFAHEEPQYLVYTAGIGMTAAVLLAAWGVFIWLNRAAEQLEPDAMQQAKREDRKIEKAAKGDDKR